jgi:hypothetical protein
MQKTINAGKVPGVNPRVTDHPGLAPSQLCNFAIISEFPLVLACAEGNFGFV